MRPALHLTLAAFIPAMAAAEPSARYVVGLSDVDMAGTAYEDGQLGPPLDAVDTLSVFDMAAPEAAIASIAASNSVFSPPTVLDISPDSRRAVVVETLQARGDSDVTLSDLEARPGTALRLYDLSDPTAPTLLNQVEVPARPQAAQFNAAGDLVAVTGLPTANGLTLVPVGEEGLGTPLTFDLELTDRGDIPFDPAHNVLFHPREDIVAVALTLRSQIAFYRIERAGGVPSGIRPWGNLVATNKFPIAGAFTPDGRHYITSDLMWRPDVQRFYGALGRGTMTTIRLAAPDSEAPRHEIVAIATGGHQAESIAVNPAGDRIAISSMRTTGLPPESALFDPRASVSLYAFDGETGALSLIEEVFFEAHLPQGLASDPSGSALYVGVNAYFDATDPVLQGGVELWTVEADGLTRTETRMPAPRGVHVVQVIE
ncbi:MAG: hypothetical protein AAGE18_09355 [Pseudomonadota bacterium]